jgi:signal transduction histidine kinase
MRVMGGNLSIESEVGVGTTVTLRLKPSAPPEALQTKAA